MRKLNFPTLFCHELKVKNDLIEDIKLRLPDHKRKSVQYLQKLNFEVVAAGDSYNDLGMLKTADFCMFFSPPEQLVQEYPDIKVGRDYSSLLSFIESPYS
jgi:phosphoserine/homoserine phosphotransferase